MTTLAELIGIARECKGWTLRELEKASGVSNALISQIETGKVRDPGFTTVVRLADALGLSLDRCAANERGKLGILRKHGVWKPEVPDAKPSPLPTPASAERETPKPCGLADPSAQDCPNMKEAGGGFEGERYRCEVCGKGYFLDYEDMK